MYLKGVQGVLVFDHRQVQKASRWQKQNLSYQFLQFFNPVKQQIFLETIRH